MFSLIERIYIVKNYYILSGDKCLLRKKFRQEYSKKAPTNIQIKRLITKFELAGTVFNSPSISHRQPSTNVSMVNTHFQQNPRDSIRIAAHTLNINSSTVHNILRKNLKFKPYKLQTRQLLSTSATIKRLHFANNFDTSLIGNIWFSDESYFYLNPKANKNEVYWSKTKPVDNFVQKPSHSAKILIWMAISHHGVFWRPIEGNMNSETYINLLKHQFFPYLKSRNLLESCIFMQDGAPCHTSKNALQLIHEYFNDRVISTRYPQKFNIGIEWPPYSPDLTPMDYSIWGTLKARLSKHKPKTLIELDRSLHIEVSLFTQQFIIKAIGNIIPRLQLLKQAHGGHFEI